VQTTRQATQRAGIYCRLSQDSYGKSESIIRQERDCRALADSEGFEVTTLYQEGEGVSASDRDKERPEWERMLADIRRGKLDVVIFWRLDRATRLLLDGAILLDAAERNEVAIMTFSDGVDTRTEGGQRNLGQMLQAAVWEAKVTGKRVRAMKDDSLAYGARKHGGFRGFGHDNDGNVIESEAVWIRSAVKSVVAGESIRSIARTWAEAGVVTPRQKKGRGGKPWNTSHLTRMLKSPRLCGARVAPNGEWIVGTLTLADMPDGLDEDERERYERRVATQIEPIISELEMRRMLAVLEDPTRVTTTPRKHPNLLSGLAHCGICGSRLKVSVTQAGDAVYGCKGDPHAPACGGVGVLVRLADAHVTEQLLDRLASEAILDALSRVPDDDETQRVLREVELDRKSLDDLHVWKFSPAGRSMSMPRYTSLASELESRIAEGEALLTASASVPLLGAIPADAIRELWDARSGPDGIDWRRSLVRSVIERVDVDPVGQVGVFRPERLRISPRRPGTSSATTSDIT
jgi:site-specific DNA recombinase